MQFWTGRESPNCPQGTRLLQPSCSTILNGWLSPLCSQDGCCTSRHHIFIPGNKNEREKGLNSVPAMSFPFSQRKQWFPQKSHPRKFWFYLIKQNYVKWSPLAGRKLRKFGFLARHMLPKQNRGFLNSGRVAINIS